MKPASEIFNEVGTEIKPGTSSLLADAGCRAFTASDIAKIIADAKAESKGFCEWTQSKTNWSFTTGCNRFFEKTNNFCPGCGKEIKVV